MSYYSQINILQNHIKTYFEYHGFTHQGEVMCQVCNAPAHDIHHIVPRSKFGSKRKHEQDHISNLIALCRSCHDKAHSNELTREMLEEFNKF